MNCVFCKRPCELENPDSKHIYIERCHNCPYSVRHYYLPNEDGPESALDYNFIVRYHGTEYVFNYAVNCYDLSSDSFTVSTFHYDALHEARGAVIVTLDFIPNITPYNVLDKLPTLLVFS